MYTECSHCNAVFLITAPQMEAAGGRVRCGECGQIFHARMMVLTEQNATVAEAPPSENDSSIEFVPAASPAPESAAELPVQAAPEPVAHVSSYEEAAAQPEPEPPTPYAEPVAASDSQAAVASEPEPMPEPATEPEPAATTTRIPRAASFEWSQLQSAEPYGKRSTNPYETDEAAQPEAPADRPEATQGAQWWERYADDVGERRPEPAITLNSEPDSMLARFQAELDEADRQRPEPESRLLNPPPEQRRAYAVREQTSRGLSTMRRAVLMLLGVAILAGLLFTQWVLSDEEHLARYPRLQAYAVKVCEFIGCEPPYPHERGKIAILSRNVSVDPALPKTLVVTARFVNQADRPQPFPVLKISLNDTQGQVVAQSSYKPKTYLPAGADLKLMQPGEPVDVRLEVADPGENAIAFQIDFL